MNPVLTNRGDLAAGLTLAAALHLVVLSLLGANRFAATPPRLTQPPATRVAVQLKARPRPPRPESAPPRPQPVRVPRAQPGLAPPAPALTRAAPPPPRPAERNAPPATPAPRQPEVRQEAVPAAVAAPSEAFLTAARIDEATFDGDIDTPPTPLRAIRPVYPYGARQRGEAGRVVALIHVSAQGRVEQVAIAQSSGFASLDRAAQEALRAARFEPARRGETVVPARVRLTIIFQLK